MFQKPASEPPSSQPAISARALGTLAELRAALNEAETKIAGGAPPRLLPFPELRDCAELPPRAGFVLSEDHQAGLGITAAT